MTSPTPIDAHYVRTRLDYNPETGVLTWKPVNHSAMFNTRYAGTEAGRIKNGYRTISLNGKKYLAHRLAWAIVHGDCPDTLDHKDRNGLNNRIDNLRPATAHQNSFNIAKASKEGVKGCYRTRSGRFKVQIQINRKVIYLGTFDTIERAQQRYQAVAPLFFGEFANFEGRKVAA
jgi:mRNA-degrading endonuclease RelE of RelBE toxin-antitoxin system